jgi:hypothetical protein
MQLGHIDIILPLNQITGQGEKSITSYKFPFELTSVKDFVISNAEAQLSNVKKFNLFFIPLTTLFFSENNIIIKEEIENP